MVDETIRSIKEAEQQAEEILVKAQEQKEQILKDASLQAKQIHEELIEEAKRLPVDWMRKPEKRRKNQEDKEAEKLQRCDRRAEGFCKREKGCSSAAGSF